MSVGYDLAGIRSPPVRGWIEAMKDARARGGRAARGRSPTTCAACATSTSRRALSDQITLSTFHGCPAGEIEGIVRFLLTEMGVHVTVKLNPTLLGPRGGGRPAARRARLPRDRDARRRTSTRTCSGSRRWRSPTACPSWRARWAARFQVKFSNTLVVRNHRSFFPASEAVMYLSGRAAARDHAEPGREVPARAPRGADLVLRGRRRPELPGLRRPRASRPSPPAPTCCGRAATGACPRTSSRLEERMRAAGGGADRRLRGARVRAGRGGGRGRRCRRGRLRDALAGGARRRSDDLRGRRRRRPGRASTTAIVRRGGRSSTRRWWWPASPPTRATARRTTAPCRARSARTSWLFDCINCDKCMPVCPNDANFVYEIGAAARRPTSTSRVRGGRGGRGAGGRLRGRRRSTRSRTSRTSATSAATATSSARRTAGPTSRSRASSARLDAWRAPARPRRLLLPRAPATRTRSGRASAGASTASRWTAARDRGALHRRRDHGRGAPPRAPAAARAARAPGAPGGPRPRLLRLPEHGPGRGRRARHRRAPTR